MFYTNIVKVFVFILFWQPVYISSHGLGLDTRLWVSGNVMPIAQVHDYLTHGATHTYDIKSYDTATHIYDWIPITGAAHSVTNCHMSIACGPHYNDVILCTPTQEFYIPATRTWKEAIELEPGDELLTFLEQYFGQFYE